jgi:WD40 repeat protein
MSLRVARLLAASVFGGLLLPAPAQEPAWVIPVRSDEAVVRAPRSLDFTSDGTRLVVRHAVPESRDDRLLVFEIKSGKVVTSATIADEPVMRPWHSRPTSVASDGNRVIYTQGRELRNAPLSDMDPKVAFPIRSPGPIPLPSPSFVWLSDKEKGAYVGSDAGGFALEYWDFDKGEKRAVLKTGNIHTSVEGTSLDASAGLLAVALDDEIKKSRVECWTLANKPTKVTITPPRRATSVALSPGGKVVVVGIDNGSIGWYDTGTGQQAKPAQMLGLFSVGTLAFEPGGEYLACGTWDKRGKPNLFFVRVATGEVVNEVTADMGGVTAVRFSPKGDLLAAYGNSGDIRVWRTQALLKID